MKNIAISGFSDEISSELDTQLKTVSELGMRYISLRGVDGENISKYSVESIQKDVLPRLENGTLVFHPLDLQLVKFILMMMPLLKHN
ncbi:hypothetical protein [Staphylococcus equorum]|uniref:hypothetical protein n=1 Tax=Staphylococcus equorum TaxID=246432 RepID=UPI000B1E7572|nr:hypothetical protein [Staphylococcus equorum]